MEGICKLCNKKDVLKHSHIFPNFLIKQLRSDNNKSEHLKLLSQPELKIIVKKDERPGQGGYKEYLLCGTCEQLFSIWEKYFAEIIKKIKNEDSSLSPVLDNQFNLYQNLDYQKTKLFLLSILWRCSISKKNIFYGIKLGKHEEVIRKMLLGQDAGNYDMYGIIIISICNDINFRSNCVDEKIEEDKIVFIPQGMNRIEGHNIYKITFSGYQYIIFVSSHTNRIKDSLKHAMFKENGQLIILNNICNLSNLTKGMKEI